MICAWCSPSLITNNRYTLTYTPSEDRILPSPPALYVRIKNEAAIPLRAAYLHGPYNIYVATYPVTFNPNEKSKTQRRDGIPQFEPFLKPGGEWTARLAIPEDMRETAQTFAQGPRGGEDRRSMTWIIEITSQIIFSLSASVSFELLVSRDEKSLDSHSPVASERGARMYFDRRLFGMTRGVRGRLGPLLQLRGEGRARLQANFERAR